MTEVKEARREEVTYMQGRKLLELRHLEECLEK